MDQRRYTNTTAADLMGQQAVILQPHANSHYTLPRGTVVTIIAKYAGLDVQTDPCRQCGVQVHISRVPPEKLELLADLIHRASNQSTCSLATPGSRAHPHPGRVTCPECTHTPQGGLPA